MTEPKAPRPRVTRVPARPPRSESMTRPAPVAKPRIDRFPRQPEEWKAFAALPADERAAIYLRSIRAMVLFFTVLMVIGIIATIVLMLIGISVASDTATVNTSPFG
jgi:hypothetical protein